MSDFYGAVASACFALLGLWWVVVQLNHERWLVEETTRRMAYRISLYFLLPGTISIVSLLDVESQLFWRAVFLVGAAIGLAEVAVSGWRSGHPRPQLAASFVVYLLVAGVALVPQAVRAVGIAPIVLEGVLLTLLVLLGAQLVWTQFVASVTHDA